MLSKIKNLEVGQSIKWEDSPLCCGMISDAVNRNGKQFEVRWITTNWEASLGYIKITRHV